ncbi:MULTISPECIES: tryptophan halogenase family protein [Shewanella]|jgi:tryptophan halogenase|uniref:Tryptophan 7-halogenase n=1 Tax=Shewanella psychromarinicola TaxID=2487742 RepID=A0A3N4E932_9GAMM|nr:tryptophan halogenase family protein [Shewanella psychromarinicola]AZG36884.1 tryptophan 7-halogenase [Shewanella psychromarinicola]MCL1080988.1 tryptophan 7-halogenase [Shewanella psychromarinicola]RPA34739.1 tryptophan 7-halogenase [Shewanella psychromarinicola]
MQNAITEIVIVGGGTAGWITAGLLAAEHNVDNGVLAHSPKLNITLIESPDVATIGVGEGTWPSMRSTLSKIGIDENEFIRRCDASFKQGSRFIHWRRDPASHNAQVGNPAQSDSYLHPFSLPHGHQELDLCPFWLSHADQVSFAEAVSSQEVLTQLGLAPKSISSAQYHFQNNYGYHLNAGKFSQLLTEHCTQKLGISHIRDHVSHIVNHDNGDIAKLVTLENGEISGQLFIDCSGTKSLLLGEHLHVPFLCQKAVLFNDTALAVQVPYSGDGSPIASCTHSTAQQNGWIWDIGLPTRKGVGYVYSSSHTNDADAERTLFTYLGDAATIDKLQPRKLSFNPGYRAKCWQNNCIAIGMAAGFIEPLEASALALIEWTASTLAQQLPPNRQVMDTIAARVNDRYQLHWQQIIDFLKLHYVISQREVDGYWRDHRDNQSIPDSLQAKLELWRYQVPSQYDISYKEALFPAASFQYVLYGMGFQTQLPTHVKPSMQQLAQQLFNDNQQRTQALSKSLPSNRALLEKVAQYGFPKL